LAPNLSQLLKKRRGSRPRASAVLFQIPICDKKPETLAGIAHFRPPAGVKILDTRPRKFDTHAVKHIIYSERIFIKTNNFRLKSALHIPKNYKHISAKLI